MDQTRIREQVMDQQMVEASRRENTRSAILDPLPPSLLIGVPKFGQLTEILEKVALNGFTA